MTKFPKAPWTAGQVVWGCAYAAAVAGAGFLIGGALVLQVATSEAGPAAWRGPVPSLDHAPYLSDYAPLPAPLRGYSGPDFHGERGV